MPSLLIDEDERALGTLIWLANSRKRMSTFSKQDYEKGLELHHKSIVIDTLGSAGPRGYSERMRREADRLLTEGMSGFGILTRLNKIRFMDLIKDPAYRSYFVGGRRESGVTAESHSVGGVEDRPWTYEAAVKGISDTNFLFDNVPDFVKVTKADDIIRAKRDGKFGTILNFQNSEHFEKDLDNVEVFYGLGIRVVQLTYNSRNYVGDGCTERTDAGLSEFGVQLVEKMNAIGMLIDLSHCGYSTAADAIQHSADPVSFTHTFSWSLHRHDRGKKDEQLKAVAEKGGYIGVVIVPAFLTERPRATLEDFLDHIDHLTELVGVDHVGVGTDWNGAIPHKGLADKLNEEMKTLGFRPEHRIDWNTTTEGFEDYGLWPNITVGLVSRGYSDDEVQKIIGENFLRLFENVVG